MTELAQHLSQVRHRSIVGRVEERELFRAAIADGAPPLSIFWIHGPGGIGKTTLLSAFDADARDRGFVSAMLSSDEMDPAPAAWRATVERAFAGRPTSLTAIFADACEKRPGIDAWVLKELVPSFRADRVVVALSSRDPPPIALRADPAYSPALRVVSLRNMSPEESASLLAARGVAESSFRAAHDATYGHPLGLALLGDLLKEGRPIDELLASPDLIRAILTTFVETVPSPRHREALEIAAHVLTTDEGLLRALFGDEAGPLFAWMRNLSFMRPTAEGIVPHDLARDVLDADLFWRDRARYSEMHSRVRKVIVDRILSAPPSRRMHAFRDLVFMHRRSSLYAKFTTWFNEKTFALTEVSEADRPALVDLARRVDGEACAELVAFWLERQRAAFRVFRNVTNGALEGLTCLLTLDDALLAAGAERDPAIREVTRFVERAAPRREGEVILLLRWTLIDGAPHQITPHTDAIAVMNGAAWLTTPKLAWAFMLTPRPDIWAPLWTYLDFASCNARFTLDDLTYEVFGHDFRAVTREMWLERMEQRELDAAPVVEPAALPPPRLALSMDDFSEAVRAFLRDFTRPSALAKSPLARCRFVERCSAADKPEEAIRDRVLGIARELRDDPRTEKLYRALELTYLKPAPTQEIAADRLGLPFSTYRRHLTNAVRHVTERLWDLEVS